MPFFLQLIFSFGFFFWNLLFSRVFIVKCLTWYEFIIHRPRGYRRKTKKMVDREIFSYWIVIKYFQTRIFDRFVNPRIFFLPCQFWKNREIFLRFCNTSPNASTNFFTAFSEYFRHRKCNSSPLEWDFETICVSCVLFTFLSDRFQFFFSSEINSIPIH